jgi:hypothetical protein
MPYQVPDLGRPTQGERKIAAARHWDAPGKKPNPQQGEGGNKREPEAISNMEGRGSKLQVDT